MPTQNEEGGIRLVGATQKVSLTAVAQNTSRAATRWRLLFTAVK